MKDGRYTRKVSPEQKNGGRKEQERVSREKSVLELRVWWKAGDKAKEMFVFWLLKTVYFHLCKLVKCCLGPLTWCLWFSRAVSHLRDFAQDLRDRLNAALVLGIQFSPWCLENEFIWILCSPLWNCDFQRTVWLIPVENVSISKAVFFLCFSDSHCFCYLGCGKDTLFSKQPPMILGHFWNHSNK